MKKLAFLTLSLMLSSCTITMNAWDEDADYTSEKFSESAGTESRLDANIELNAGHLAIQAAPPSELYTLDVYFNKNAFSPHTELRREEDSAFLTFDLKGEGKFSRNIGKTRVDLSLNPDVPLTLRAQTGVSETEIDLSGMTVEELNIEAGVGETRLNMATPNRTTCREVRIQSGVGAFEATGLGNLGFHDLRFEGGVGGAILDFSGEWPAQAEILIQVGVGGVEVRLPRHVGARLTTSKSFLSGVDISGFVKKGSTYYSENYDQAEPKLDIEVRAGIGGVQVRWL